VIISS